VTVKSPELPRTARLIAEIPPNLDDFFPSLPKRGNSRSHHVDRYRDTLGERHRRTPLSQRRISHYVATRDSIVDGRSATVITQRTEVRVTSTVPMQAQPYIAALSLTGEETGVSLFSVSEGRLLSATAPANCTER